jgi:hypothetical protein
MKFYPPQALFLAWADIDPGGDNDAVFRFPYAVGMTEDTARRLLLEQLPDRFAGLTPIIRVLAYTTPLPTDS